MTLTPNKGYAEPVVDGDYDTWGSSLNGNVAILDNNLGATATVSVAGSSNVTATSGQAQCMSQNLIGALTGNIRYILPAVGGFYIVTNNTTGAFTLSIASAGGGNIVAIAAGKTALMFCDGTNILSATTAYARLADDVAFNSLAVVGGTAFASGVTATGEDGSGFAFRGIEGDYGFGIFSNGTVCILAQTASGDQHGNLTAQRPLLWNLVDGTVQIDATGAGTSVSGIFTMAKSAIVIASSGGLIGFYTAGPTLVGSITTSGGVTAYNTTSDARLKVDIGPVPNSGSIVDQLRPLMFCWKAEPDAAPQPGFFAQEVAGAFPWAVTEAEGDPDDDGFKPWQMDAAKLMPVVIAELQTLRRRVAELETRR